MVKHVLSGVPNEHARLGEFLGPRSASVSHVRCRGSCAQRAPTLRVSLSPDGRAVSLRPRGTSGSDGGSGVPTGTARTRTPNVDRRQRSAGW